MTESDRTTDMVALFNGLDKNLVQRLLFSGKVDDTSLWLRMLEAVMKKRLSEWQHAVVFRNLDPRTRGVETGLRGGALTRALADVTEECTVADELLSRAAGFFLQLIDRSTSEGAVLATLLLGNDEAIESGAAMLKFIGERACVSNPVEVKQLLAEVAKLKFVPGGDTHAQEGVFVAMKALYERIHPLRRTSATQLQEIMIDAMPNNASTERTMLSNQLLLGSLDLGSSGSLGESGSVVRFPSPDKLLIMITTVLRGVKPAPVTLVQTSGGGAAPVRRWCLNCKEPHKTVLCTFKCTDCGLSFCGSAQPGSQCPTRLQQFPARIMNADNNPIPLHLYRKVKEVWESKQNGAGSSDGAQRAAGAEAGATTNVHDARPGQREMAEMQYMSQFGAGPAFQFTSAAVGDVDFDSFEAVQVNSEYLKLQSAVMGEQCELPCSGSALLAMERPSRSPSAVCLAGASGAVTPGAFVEDERSGLLLTDSCTNDHVLKTSSGLLSGSQHLIRPPGDRTSIGGANEQAPTMVRGEVTLTLMLKMSSGSSVQWMSPLVPQTKLFAHVLSSAMRAPPPAAALLLDMDALDLDASPEDGITFAAQVPEVEIADVWRRHVVEGFSMADGSPKGLVVAYDSTFGLPEKAVVSTVTTLCGGAIDVQVNAVPGSPVSSAEAEAYAQSVAVARGVVAAHVVAALGGSVPIKIPLLGDNSAAVETASGEASMGQMRHIARRIAFTKEQCGPDGLLRSIKVPTEENPADMLGKLVPAEKVARSMAWMAGRKRQPSVAVLKDGARSVPVLGGVPT